MTRPGRQPVHAKGHTGEVSFDGRMVTISRRGFLARASVGKGDKRIPVAAITAVQWKPAGPVMNGVIAFTIGGGNERRSRFGHQTGDAVRDENSVVFTRRQQDDFETVRDAIETAIGDRMDPTPAAPSGEDQASQLERLAALYQSGALTAAEFTAAKTRILRGL